MSWTRKELLEAASRYQRDLKGRAGEHYAALAAEEARRFVDWLGGEAGGSAARAHETPPGRGPAAGVPPRIEQLVQDWIDRKSPSQHASTWIRSAWSAMLPEHEGLLDSLPDELDRPLVRGIAAHAAESPEKALRAFLAVMVWGFGTRPLGPFRTRRILDEAADAPERLMAVARAVSRSAEDGYRHLAKAGRMKYLGPAYGTKYLLFAQPPTASPTALILDSYVAEGLEELAGVRLDPVPWRWSTYERYLGLIHAWAQELGLTAEELEYIVFQWVANRHGGQWAADEE